MMRTISLELEQSEFNAFWRSLADRERHLLTVIEANDEESDTALAANDDIIQIRGLQQFLREKANAAGFGEEAFDTSEETIDIASL
jgi:hypothetical protein